MHQLRINYEPLYGPLPRNQKRGRARMYVHDNPTPRFGGSSTSPMITRLPNGDTFPEEFAIPTDPYQGKFRYHSRVENAWRGYGRRYITQLLNGTCCGSALIMWIVLPSYNSLGLSHIAAENKKYIALPGGGRGKNSQLTFRSEDSYSTCKNIYIPLPPPQRLLDRCAWFVDATNTLSLCSPKFSPLRIPPNGYMCRYSAHSLTRSWMRTDVHVITSVRRGKKKKKRYRYMYTWVFSTALSIP